MILHELYVLIAMYLDNANRFLFVFNWLGRATHVKQILLVTKNSVIEYSADLSQKHFYEEPLLQDILLTMANI